MICFDGIEIFKIIFIEYDCCGWGLGGVDLYWYCIGDLVVYVGIK